MFQPAHCRSSTHQLFILQLARIDYDFQLFVLSSRHFSDNFLMIEES